MRGRVYALAIGLYLALAGQGFAGICMVDGEFTPEWTAFYEQCRATCAPGGALDVCGYPPGSDEPEEQAAWERCLQAQGDADDACWRGCTNKTMDEFNCFGD